MAQISLIVNVNETTPKASLDNIWAYAKKLEATPIKLSFDPDSIKTIENSIIKATNAQAKYINAQARMKEAENAVALAREKTKQSMEATTQSANKLATQMESTATAEEKARQANTELSTEIQKATTEQEKQKTSAANLKLQQEKTATSAANLAAQQDKAAASAGNMATQEDKASKSFNAETAEQQINNLTKAFSNLQNTMQNSSVKYKAGTFNDLIASAKSAVTETQALWTSYQNGTITQEQFTKSLTDMKTKFSSVSSSFATTRANTEQLGNTVVSVGDRLSNVLVKISKWAIGTALIYTPIKALRSAFEELTETLIETEDAVVELQRVLNTEDIANTTIASELYDLAEEYGSGWEDVSEVAEKWAQAGYEWNDVLTLTEGTMLALNTAELDATSGTESLIAVMKQFKIDASDYEETIDLLNKTADDYSVTTEDLVAAIQRMGSASVNAKMDLQETIAVITALAEATGRAGSNLGTALNSLIVYTSKAKALEVFSGLSNSMAEVVDQYQMGAASIYDIWQQLSVEIGSLTAEQSAKLEEWYATDEASEMMTSLESELGDINDTINDVYATSNTFRRNYFTALLSNFATAEDALTNMSDATGYSQKENEIYMESYTAQVNEMKSAWAAVASDAQGFLSLMKTGASVLTWLAHAVEYTGGLKTTLLVIVSLLTTLGSGAVGLGITKLVNGFTSLKGAFTGNTEKIKALNLQLTQLQAEYNAAEVASAKYELQTKITTTQQQIQNATYAVTVSRIGLVITALTAAYAIYQGINSAIEASRAAAVEASKSYSDTATALRELLTEVESSSAIEDETERTQALADIQSTLRDEYGLTIDAANDTADAHKKLTDAINDEIASSATQSWYGIRNNYAKAANALETSTSDIDFGRDYGAYATYGQNTSFISPEAVEIIESYGASLEKATIGAEDFYAGINLGTSSIEEQQDILADMVIKLEKVGNVDSRVITYLNAQYADNAKILEKWSETYEQGVTALANYLALSIDSQDSYDTITGKIGEYVEEADAQKDVLDALTILFPEYSGAVNDAADETDSLLGSAEDLAAVVEELSANLEELNGVIDDVQSSLKIIQAAQEEYAKNGELSIDTVQDLLGLSVEYLNALIDENGQINLNSEAVAALVNDKTAYLKTLAAENVATYAVTSLQALMTKSTDDAAESAGNAEGNLRDAAAAMMDMATGGVAAAAGVNLFNEAMDELAGEYDTTGIDLEAWKADVLEYADDLTAIINAAGQGVGGWTGGSSSDSGSSSSSSAAETAEDIYDELRDALDDEIGVIQLKIDAAEFEGTTEEIIALYKQMQDEVHALAETYRAMGLAEDSEYILELKSMWWDYEQEIEDVYGELTDDLDSKLSIIKLKIDVAEYEGTTDEIIALYKQMQDEVHTLAETYRTMGLAEDSEYILELKSMWWDYEGDIKDILDELTDDALAAAEEVTDKLSDMEDEQLSELDEQLEELEGWYEEQSDELDAQLAILEEENEAREDAITLEEKLLAVQEAEVALANAQAERTVHYYNAATGQWEWMADYNTVQDATEALEEAQQDLTDYYADEAYEAAKEEIEAQQDELDAIYEDLKEDVETQQENIEAAYDAFETAWDEASTAVESGSMTLAEAYTSMAGTATELFDTYAVDLTEALANLLAALGGSSSEASTSDDDGTADEDSSSDEDDTSGSSDTVTATASDGSTYTITSAKGLAYAKALSDEDTEAGTELKGSDGSTWTSNGDGTFTITTASGLHTYTASYDQGGVLKGMGHIRSYDSGGVKRTNKDEVIIEPDTTEQILNPESNRQFTSFIDNIGALYGMAKSADTSGGAVSSNSNSTYNNGNTYNLNGVSIPAAAAENLTVKYLVRMFDTLSLYPSE